MDEKHIVWEMIKAYRKDPAYPGPYLDAGSVARTKIPGGWLMCLEKGVTFVPDPNHEWDGGSLP
jgi:hypothetical protein